MVIFRDFLKNNWMESNIEEWWLTIDPLIYTQSPQPIMIEYYHDDNNTKKRGFIKKKRFFSPSIPETLFTMIDLAENASNNSSFRCWYPDDSPLQKDVHRLISSKSHAEEENSSKESSDLHFEILRVERLAFHPYNLSRVTKRSLLDDLEFHGRKATVFAAQLYFQSSNKTWENRLFEKGKKGYNILNYLSNHDIINDLVMDELIASTFKLGAQVVIAFPDTGELTELLARLKAVLGNHGFKVVKTRGSEKKKNLEAFIQRKPVSTGCIIPPSMLKNLIATRNEKMVIDESNGNTTRSGKQQAVNSGEQKENGVESTNDPPVPPLLEGLQANG